MTAEQRSKELRRLLWGWLPQEPEDEDRAEATLSAGADLEPSPEDLRTVALALLACVAESRDTLDRWERRLVRVAAEHGADNPAIGKALGVGKEAIRRRLLKEPQNSR